MIENIVIIGSNPIDYFKEFCFFRTPITQLCLEMIKFHNLIMYILLILFVMLTYVFISLMIKFKTKKDRKEVFYEFNHGVELEIIWTLFPILILIYIAFPSFLLLYELDESYISKEKGLSVKIIGHQWYWSYEVNYLKNLELKNNKKLIESVHYEMDSYMIKGNEKKKNQYLNVDNALYLPVNMPIRLIITSSDVLHSWTVPSLGIKMDAVPGRLNQVMIIPRKTGVYYGQCSEICGVNHGFMPIKVVIYEDNLRITKSIKMNKKIYKLEGLSEFNNIVLEKYKAKLYKHIVKDDNDTYRDVIEPIVTYRDIVQSTIYHAENEVEENYAEDEVEENSTSFSVENSAGNNVENTGNNVETTGNNVETTGNNVETTLNNVETTGNNVETPGNNVETTGNNVETTLNNVENAGNNVETEVIENSTGNNVETTGNNVENTGNNVENTGNNVENSAGNNVETEVIENSAENSAGNNVETEVIENSAENSAENTVEENSAENSVENSVETKENIESTEFSTGNNAEFSSTVNKDSTAVESLIASTAVESSIDSTVNVESSIDSIFYIVPSIETIEAITSMANKGSTSEDDEEIDRYPMPEGLTEEQKKKFVYIKNFLIEIDNIYEKKDNFNYHIDKHCSHLKDLGKKKPKIYPPMDLEINLTISEIHLDSVDFINWLFPSTKLNIKGGFIDQMVNKKLREIKEEEISLFFSSQIEKSYYKDEINYGLFNAVNIYKNQKIIEEVYVKEEIIENIFNTEKKKKIIKGLKTVRFKDPIIEDIDYSYKPIKNFLESKCEYIRFFHHNFKYQGLNLSIINQFGDKKYNPIYMRFFLNKFEYQGKLYIKKDSLEKLQNRKMIKYKDEKIEIKKDIFNFIQNIKDKGIFKNNNNLEDNIVFKKYNTKILGDVFFREGESSSSGELSSNLIIKEDKIYRKYTNNYLGCIEIKYGNFIEKNILDQNDKINFIKKMSFNYQNIQKGLNSIINNNIIYYPENPKELEKISNKIYKKFKISKKEKENIIKSLKENMNVEKCYFKLKIKNKLDKELHLFNIDKLMSICIDKDEDLYMYESNFDNLIEKKDNKKRLMCKKFYYQAYLMDLKKPLTKYYFCNREEGIFELIIRNQKKLKNILILNYTYSKLAQTPFSELIMELRESENYIKELMKETITCVKYVVKIKNKENKIEEIIKECHLSKLENFNSRDEDELIKNEHLILDQFIKKRELSENIKILFDIEYLLHLLKMHYCRHIGFDKTIILIDNSEINHQEILKKIKYFNPNEPVIIEEKYIRFREDSLKRFNIKL